MINNKLQNKNKKIAVFYGGKVTKHLKLLVKAAKKEKVELELISYNQVCFDTSEGKVKIRGKSLSKMDSNEVIFENKSMRSIEDYGVLFFRTTGKHWEEVDLIINSIPSGAKALEGSRQIVVDPLVITGKPSYACKAYQMMELERAGIRVPRTIYGSLWYLYEIMANEASQNTFCSAHASAKPDMTARQKSTTASPLSFPVVLKGSGGDRGTRVFKADNLEELEALVRKLRKSETEEGKRYMLQEFIENEGDYRILVLGEKVLGVMKRTRQVKGEFRNNFSMGGRVEIGDLPEWVKQKAVEATKVCGLMVAGVDIIYKFKIQNLKLLNKIEEYYVLEVNKGPQFWGFMEATGIDVPREIVRFLAELKTE